MDPSRTPHQGSSEAVARIREPTEVETLKPALAERFGTDFVGLVEGMKLLNPAHLRELLDASPEEQDQLVMAWMKAAATLEAEWSAQSRRLADGQQLSLARHMEIRLPSPRQAVAAQRGARQKPPSEASAEKPPTPRERESAQRRIRLERAITEARAALRRVDALDRLEPPDRQAIIQQLEDVISLISRRLNP